MARRPSRRRRLRTLLLALLGALLVLGAAASPASAHTELERTTPADGEVVATAPTEVDLVFGGPVGTAFGALEVRSAEGDRVDSGRVSTSDAGRVVHVPLQADLAQGTYVVVWRVVSEDGHPVGGTTTFSVGQASAVSAGATGPSAPDGPGALLGATRLLGFAGLLAWLGGALFCLLLWRAGTAQRAVRALLGAAVAVELVAAAAALLLQGPYAAGLGAGSALDGGLLRDVLDTRYGVATGARVLLSAAAVGGWLLLRRSPRPALLALVGLGATTTVTWSAAGHAGVGVWQPATAVLDVTHLLAVSAWVGGLAVLLLALRGRWSDEEAARALPQWSRVATWAVGLLVASGVFAAYREVRSVEAVADTDYGRLLALKVALVALMLLAGTSGRAWVRRHHGQADSRWARRHPVTVVHAATTTALERPDHRAAPDPAAVAALRRGVTVETALAVVVLAVTALLVQTPPAVSVAASAPAPVEQAYAGSSVAGPLTVRVVVAPARRGVNAVRLTTLDAQGAARDVEEVTGSLTGPGGATSTLRPTRTAAGTYEDLDVVLPSSGSWMVMLQLRVGELDSWSAMQTFEVR